MLAKRSKLVIILSYIYHNLYMKGKIETGRGSVHTAKTVPQSLEYIQRVFNDYLTYAGLSIDTHQNKWVLEIGPGDNLGVALKFLVAGADRWSASISSIQGAMLPSIARSASIALLERMRSHFQPEFKKISDEELMIAGIFVVAKKPEISPQASPD